MSRYFCFYRPHGYIKNNYLFFYCKDPVLHEKSISNVYKTIENSKFFDTTYDLNIMKYKPILIRTKYSYTNYKKIHQSISDKFVTTKYIPNAKINYWPYINMSDNDAKLLHDVDEYIDCLSENLESSTFHDKYIDLLLKNLK